jgi:type IV secretory pathway VirJ component
MPPDVDDVPMKFSLQSVPVKPLFVIVLLALVPLMFGEHGADVATITTLKTRSFGDVQVYARDRVPDSVVLLVSGEDGWDDTVDDMAKKLQNWGALVAGVDGRRYLESLGRHRDACANPAQDLEELGGALQRYAHVDVKQVPVLIGYGVGAAIVYAGAAQARPGVFAATTSIGFCPRLPLDVPLCTGAGVDAASTTAALAPKADLAMPWILLHGTDDDVCPIDTARAFAAAIPSAKVVTMPKVGHRFGEEGQWLDQFRDAYLKLATATTERRTLPADVRDLPLVEVPSTGGSSRKMAVLLTGDGGWAGLDRGLSDRLAASGIPVVALSTLRYFWMPQKPETVAHDLERIMAHYLKAWNKDQVLLIGYSFGANVLPFVVADLAPDSRSRIATLNLLGLATHTSFEIHVADWIPGSEPEGAAIAPEFDKLAGIRTLCIYGSAETDSLCPALPASTAFAIKMPGDHHFNDDTATLVRHIVEFAAK